MSRQCIRVNLQFGPRTDAALWAELTARPPYSRAKFLRELLLEALRYRSGAAVPASKATVTGPSFQNYNEEGAFTNGVAGLLGTSLRL